MKVKSIIRFPWSSILVIIGYISWIEFRLPIAGVILIAVGLAFLGSGKIRGGVILACGYILNYTNRVGFYGGPEMQKLSWVIMLLGVLILDFKRANNSIKQ